MTMHLLNTTLIYLLLGYLAGSIPFGIIISRLYGLGNLRDIGSGNIGATNVLRTGNKLAAILTLIFDAAKAVSIVALVNHFDTLNLLMNYKSHIVAFGAVLGHIYPVWLGFKGGKGVATVAGCSLILNIWVGLALIATWIVTFIIKRLSSLSAIVATILAPIIAFLCDDLYLTYWFAIVSPLVLYTHRDNIKRLIQQKEIGLSDDTIKK